MTIFEVSIKERIIEVTANIVSINKKTGQIIFEQNSKEDNEKILIAIFPKDAIVQVKEIIKENAKH